MDRACSLTCVRCNPSDFRMAASNHIEDKDTSHRVFALIPSRNLAYPILTQSDLNINI